jgi:hypothetical protein
VEIPVRSDPRTFARIGAGLINRQVELTTRQAVILAGGPGHADLPRSRAGIRRRFFRWPVAPFCNTFFEYLAGQGITEALLLLGVGAEPVIAATAGRIRTQTSRSLPL